MKEDYLYKYSENNLDPKIEDPLPRIEQIFGSLQIVTTAPTSTPITFGQHFVLYTDSLSSPTVYRLYIYFPKLNSWHYVALT